MRNESAFIVKNESLFKFEAREGVISIGSNISKRDWFAGLAMQGLSVPAIIGTHNLNEDSECRYKAKMAVRLADALIAELERTEE